MKEFLHVLRLVLSQEVLQLLYQKEIGHFRQVGFCLKGLVILFFVIVLRFS
jgi:hypothetical protein